MTDRAFKVGPALRELRIKNHLTQEEMAKKLGYKSKTTITKLEKNENSLSLDKLISIADTFNVDPQSLIDASGIDETLVQIGSKNRFTEDYKAIIQTLDVLTPEQLSQFRQICDTLYPMPQTLIKNPGITLWKGRIEDVSAE